MALYKNIANAKIKAAEMVYVEHGEIAELTDEDAAVYLGRGNVEAVDPPDPPETLASGTGDGDDTLAADPHNRKVEGEEHVEEATDPDKPAPTRRRRY